MCVRIQGGTSCGKVCVSKYKTETQHMGRGARVFLRVYNDHELWEGLRACNDKKGHDLREGLDVSVRKGMKCGRCVGKREIVCMCPWVRERHSGLETCVSVFFCKYMRLMVCVCKDKKRHVVEEGLCIRP